MISIRGHYVTFPSLNWPNVLDVSQGRSQWLSRYSDSGIQMPVGSGKRCFFSEMPGPTLDPTQPPIQRVQWYSSARLKWPRREDDLLPPSSAEIKNEWGSTSKTSVCFRFSFFALRSLWCGVQLSPLLHTAGWNKCSFLHCVYLFKRSRVRNSPQITAILPGDLGC